MKTSLFRRLSIRFLILGAAVCALKVQDAEAREIFAELVDAPQVESTYISGNLFSCNDWTPFFPTSSMAANIDISNFSEMYLYNIYSQEGVSKARRILDNYIEKNKNVKLALRNQNSHESYLIYKKLNKSGQKEELIIWSSAGKNTCQIVVLEWETGEESRRRTVPKGNISVDLEPLGSMVSDVTFKALRRLMTLPQPDLTLQDAAESRNLGKEISKALAKESRGLERGIEHPSAADGSQSNGTGSFMLKKSDKGYTIIPLYE